MYSEANVKVSNSSGLKFAGSAFHMVNQASQKNVWSLRSRHVFVPAITTGSFFGGVTACSGCNCKRVGSSVSSAVSVPRHTLQACVGGLPLASV